MAILVRALCLTSRAKARDPEVLTQVIEKIDRRLDPAPSRGTSKAYMRVEKGGGSTEQQFIVFVRNFCYSEKLVLIQ
jgi:hypothetical protein